MTMPMLPADEFALPDEALLASLEEELPVEAMPEPEPEPEPELDENTRRAMRALYGEEFPLAKDSQAEGDWALWAKDLWERHQPGKRQRLHGAERNRLMRRGTQWLSALGLQPWREPPKPKDAVRAVYNMIGPALDQRVQLVGEQRPGWRVKPTNAYDRDDRKLALAAQLATEYQYDQQKMADVLRETAYWAGTDGCAFWLVYWDADAGPWHEATVVDEQGNPAGQERYPMGDIRTRVYRLEQVTVSANATATQRPWYWVIKETIPVAEAVAFHGTDVIEQAEAGSHGSATVGGFQFGTGLSEPNELLEGQDTVERYIVFCEPSEYLPKGLTVVVVGDREVSVSDLLCGVVPMVRITDGTTDPSFFPCPIVDGWVDHQMRVNVILSKWIESVRANAGGRFAAKPKTVSTESLVNGLFSLLEVRAPGPISDALMPIPGFSVGNDAKELLANTIKAFEDISGWNDTSRGSVSGESGRAILASREALERIFAEPINAIARGMTDWAKICLAWMKWGYDLPRTISTVGKGRPDLGRAITKDDFDGVADIEANAETLVPMPRSFRMFMLDQYLEKQIITPKQYLQRQPMGFIEDFEQPDDDHAARAQRVADQIKEGIPMEQLPPIYWQDDEAIHQSVLEREIILTDQFPPPVVAVAHMRWVALAQQAQMKGMMVAGPPGGMPQPGGGMQPSGLFQPGPQSQPLLGQNTGLSAAPVAQTSGFQQERMAQQLGQG